MDICRQPSCWLAVSPSTSTKHDDVILLLRCKGWRSLVHLVVVSISQGVKHSLRYRRLRHIIICAYNNSRCFRNVKLGVSQHHHDVDPDIIRREMFARHQILKQFRATYYSIQKMETNFIFQSLRCKILLINIIHATAVTIKLVFFIIGVDIGSHS